MTAKKWFVMFGATIALCFALWAVLNIVVDPFRVFGDSVLHWDAYDITNNPRVGKVAYLEEHGDEFDSFIIGSSSAALYDINTLNKEMDASFYNMFCYGPDVAYYEDLVEYLANNYDVKNIILNLAINEANKYWQDGGLNTQSHINVSGENSLKYYGKYLFASPDYAIEKLRSYFDDTFLPQSFDVFIPETGSYDKRVRDIEPIAALSDYLAEYEPVFEEKDISETLSDIDACIDAVTQIKQICADSGINLTVIFSPVCARQLEGYSDQTITEYMEKLAEVTDYWNFSISSISYDERYFYDSRHTRNAVGDMMLATIFEQNDIYVPEDFGTLVTKDNVSGYCKRVLGDTISQDYSDYTVNVPILLYHDIAESGDYAVTKETFARHMKCLYDNGYTAVGLDDLIQYVYYGMPLPEKSVVVTFDDGYTSNYEYAYPILSQYGFKAVIFQIGVSIGKDYYKDTQFPINPHFGFEEMREMLDSGLIELQSHTYDMHQWEPFESGGLLRPSILKPDGENDESYISALEEDFAKEADILKQGGVTEIYALAFPGGKTSTLTEVVMDSLGIKATVTTDEKKINTLVKGLPQSLLGMGRVEFIDSTSDREIIECLEKYLNTH